MTGQLSQIASQQRIADLMVHAERHRLVGRPLDAIDRHAPLRMRLVRALRGRRLEARQPAPQHFGCSG
jgi:hypothetical protein